MNMQYFGDISVGGQKVPAIFDTGSFEVIVASTRCKQCRDPPYNPQASKSFRPSQPTKAVQHLFGSGPVNSELGFESVQVGPLTSSEQAFYQIVKHDIDVLNSGSFDAIVGLAPEGHNLTEKTLTESLHLSEFSLCLEPDPGAPGWLTWGGDLTPEQKASAAVMQVIGQHHWVVSLRDIMPAMPLSKDQIDAAQTLFCGRGCAAILDSGTSLISAPAYALRGLEILLPKLHENCSNFETLPNLEFVIGGLKVQLPPEAYAVRLRGTASEKRNAGNLLHFMAKEDTPENDGDQCVYGFMEVNRHTDFGPLWIFGMPFFRVFHTTFKNAPNPKDRKIYLMGADNDCKPQPPSVEAEFGAAEPKPDYRGEMGVFPKMAVLNSVGPQRRQDRTHRGPLTLEARNLRPPPSLETL